MARCRKSRRFPAVALVQDTGSFYEASEFGRESGGWSAIDETMIDGDRDVEQITFDDAILYHSGLDGDAADDDGQPSLQLSQHPPTGRAH